MQWELYRSGESKQTRELELDLVHQPQTRRSTVRRDRARTSKLLYEMPKHPNPLRSEVFLDTQIIFVVEDACSKYSGLKKCRTGCVPLGMSIPLPTCARILGKATSNVRNVIEGTTSICNHMGIHQLLQI